MATSLFSALPNPADHLQTSVSDLDSFKGPLGTVASLIYIYPKSPDLGRRFLLDGAANIGRAADCDVHTPHDSVSRHHVRIEAGIDGVYRATDMGSTNGTYINNRRVQSAELRDGDYLRAGNCIFRFLARGNVEAEYHEEIYRLTVIDPLTNVHNRRYFNEILAREVARSCRHVRPLALVLFDIDHFKSVNDKLGHVAGDLTLRSLAECVQPLIRTDEVFARYGGEEFAVVLTETDSTRAAEFGERVRAAVEAHPFEFEGKRFQVTVSVGIGAMDGSVQEKETDLIQRADANLYSSKKNGRNRVTA